LKILVDVNISKKVYWKLKSLGFDVAYVTDFLPGKTSDENILKWMKEHNALIITGDKGFPGASHRKVILAGTFASDASKEAVTKLIILRVFPEGLESSAELNIFSSFMREIDPFFKGLNTNKRTSSLREVS